MVIQRCCSGARYCDGHSDDGIVIFNIQGLRVLADRVGFELVEVGERVAA
jgi:hypothetical protein